MVIRDDISEAELKKPRKKREPKAPKEKPPEKTLKEVFLTRLAEIQLEEIKKPWMAEKAFRLIDEVEVLDEWIGTILSDPSRIHALPWADHVGPVVSVDTETDGLDVRVLDGKIKTNLAGVCLSADGVEGIYIPVGHEGCKNITSEDLAPRLQKLFDQSHLVFFNAKFDREILRLTLGITFREYPHFEDVQVLSYLHDPKAKVDPGAGGFQSGGLKATSKSLLGIEQIELEELVKVRAKVWNEELQKSTNKMVYAPFTWVPTELALWYAAGDAITTWLLWQKFWVLRDFTKMSAVHRVDHVLVDTIAWIERQRIRVDVGRLENTIKFHEGRVNKLTQELGQISGIADFNPGSTPQLRKILFEDKKMEILGTSEKTGDASTSIGVLKELQKKYPDDEFLSKLMDFREYAALHPGNLHYERADGTARFYFKQNVVAGGRLAAAGGEYTKDGGCGLNPQAIKKVGGNRWVMGKPIKGEFELTQFDQSELDKSCFNKDGKKAPNIDGNHIGTYFGEPYCMVPSCTVHTQKAIKVDANEVINLRGLFTADPGWTMFSIDYSNIEMRVAANVSGEKAFIDEFLVGSGDFHTLTAKALFPEFSVAGTAKSRTKELRSLAKIINFALLYGGTAYTIHENLNKAGFPMSFEEAQELVNKYWESVPTFAVWCQMKRNEAKTKLMCRTPTGRVIQFDSAMQGYGITEPNPEDRTNFFTYKRIKKEEAEALKRGDKEEARALRRQADAMWKDTDNGIRNYQEYNRFLGKAERVSINIPLQGTAGDLMRSALNRIREWAMKNPGIEKVFRLHETVHDEVDFSVKNEFVPYVLPRINRLMKLRNYHKAKKWSVPIETDCEYGQTWDVQHHLTGDNEHTASAWTEIEGLETYLPAQFSQKVVTQAGMAWPENPDRVKTWLRQCHPRTHHLIDKLTHVDGEPWHLAKGIEAILQLHEFWVTDENENDKLTLLDWMNEQGLKLPLDPLIGGLDGYLASIRLGNLESPVPSDSGCDCAEKENQVCDVCQGFSGQDDPEPIEEPEPEEEVEEPEEEVEEPPPVEEEEESVLYEPPSKPKKAQPEPEDKPKLPTMRTISKDETAVFVKSIGLGAGYHSFSVMYKDIGQLNFVNVAVTALPPEYLNDHNV